MSKSKTLKWLALTTALCQIGLTSSQALEVRSVGSLIDKASGDRIVQVTYDETVNASGGDAGSYSLSDGTIVSATRVTGLAPADNYVTDGFVSPLTPPDGRPLDNAVVELIVTGLTEGSSYDLTISGVMSEDGDALADTTRSFSASPFQRIVIGGNDLGNRAPGTAIMVGNDGIDVVSNGATMWSNYDEADAALMPITGAFDKKAQVVYQDVASQWSRAGIIVRENLDEGRARTANAEGEDPDGFGRYVTAHANREADFNTDGTVNPVGGNGVDTGTAGFESNYRQSNGAATSGDGGNINPVYPDGAWVRIQRVGDTVKTYFGSDGEEWNQYGGDRVFPDLAETLWFGAFYSPETGNTGGFLNLKPTLAQIRSIQDIPFGAVAITEQPQGFTESENNVAQLSVVATGPALFQWYQNGSPRDGANSAILSFASGIKATDAGTWYVRVENPLGEGVDSNEVTVEVLGDEVPPAPTWGAMIDLANLTTRWSEAIDPTTGSNPANYSIQGGSGSVNSATVDPANPTQIDFAISGLSDGQNYTLVITGVQDTAGNTVAADTVLQFAAQDIINVIWNPEPVYVPLPTRRRSDLGTGTADGFNLKIVQNTTGASSIDQAETQQLAGLNGLPNLASPETTTDTTINYADPDGSAAAGILRGSPRPYPSVVGEGTDPDNTSLPNNFAIEATTFLELRKGVYSIGVASDDGFRLRCDKTVIVEFAAPRGADVPDFVEIVVTEDGLYPFTLTYFEAGGGASLEFLAASDPNPANTSSLVSSINETAYIKAYRTRNFVEPQQPVPSVDTIIPGDLATAVDPATTVSVILTDGASALNSDSFQLTVDGNAAPVVLNQTGDQFILTHTPAEPFDSFTTHTAAFAYTHGDPAVSASVSWSFETGFNFVGNNQAVLDLFSATPGTRFIEAEDFNGTVDAVAGQWIPDANGGKDGVAYAGGAYSGLSATHDVDYHEDSDVVDGDNYRVALEVPNVPMGGADGDNTFGFTRGDRGNFTLTTNFQIGWGTAGDWRNYTRDFNAGTYDVYVAVSNGGGTPDAGSVSGTVGIVTSDPAQPDQTLSTIGEFSGPWSGDWGTMAFYKLHAVGNPDLPAQATMPDGNSTVRFTWVNAGDTDFIAFVPAEPIVPDRDDLIAANTSAGDVPAAAGTGLSGMYWQLGVKEIENLQDFGGDKDIGLKIINSQPADATFISTQVNYSDSRGDGVTRNDLTTVIDWLGSDNVSLDPIDHPGNFDEGLVKFQGYLAVHEAGEMTLRSESDDGSVVWISGVKVVDNDGSHGAPGPSPDGTAFFEAPGLYPIEIAFFNGDWVSDDGLDHGGANLNFTSNGGQIATADLYPADQLGIPLIMGTTASEIPGEDGTGLAGRYWQRDVKSITGIAGDGQVIIDTVVPDARFTSTRVNYSDSRGDGVARNDLTPIIDWLGSDSGSLDPLDASGNMDEGLLSFTGLIAIREPGQIDFRSASDDGSVVRIGGTVVVDNDGSHGAPGDGADGSAFFPAAGLYPIEVSFYNGDWVSDDGLDHGGANIEFTSNGGEIATADLYPVVVDDPAGGGNLIGISQDAGAVTLTWDTGALHYSATVDGVFAPVAEATSPYDATGAPGYYIVQ